MTQVLYRKYRSKSFGEVLGQSHITDTLQKAVKNGQLSHAYLFTGPRGVGKTSVARILAYAANGIDYDQGGSHLDIIEIDGASNRRIEEIRDLRDKARILPSAGRYKVYIIDEVHMLTREAFNALLKTLEEPSAHCIFILATTEAHKLPQTIVSRTQRFSFRPIDSVVIAKHVSQIAKQEKINIDEAAVNLIAVHGDGSFRDSISLLDQLSTTKSKIDEKAVQQMLGIAPAEMIENIAKAVQSKDQIAALSELQAGKDLGLNPANIAKALSAKIRTQIAGGQVAAKTIDLLKELIEVPASFSPQDRLEVVVLTASMGSESMIAGTKEPKSVVEPLPVTKETTSKKDTQKKPGTPTAQPKLKALDWAKLQSAVKERDSAVGLALKHSVAKLRGKTLKIIFCFPLYKNKVASAAGKAVVSAAAEEILGTGLTIDYVVDKAEYAKVNAAPSGKEQSMEAISNIFGGGEVVESSIS